MKKSKVIKVWPAQGQNGEHKSFTTQNGTFYSWGVVFENGDVGEFNTVNQDINQCKFKVGQEASYEITQNPPFPDKVKYVNEDFKGGGFKSKKNDALIVRQVAVKSAVEYYSQRKDGDISNILEMAKKLNDWIMQEEKEEELTTQQPQAEGPPPQELIPDQSEQLPF